MLRARNLGEADRIVTLLSLENGKIDAVAKGLRRPTSRFAGRLEFLTEASVSLHRGRSLDVITGASILRSHWNEIVAPAPFAVASLLAEHVDRFCELDLPVPDIYALLRGAIEALASRDDPAAVVPRFQLRLLAALGLAPPADACVRCQSDLDGHAAWIDPDAGGLLCEACGGARGDASALAAADVANFAALAEPRTAARAALIATPRAASAIDRLVEYHLGRRLRSQALVDALPGSR